jgi:uncharacterized membrane protein
MIVLSTSDILSYFLLEYHAIYFLLSFLIAYYWYRESPLIMTTGILLLATESFIIYESSLIALLYALPAFALIKVIKNRLYITPLQPVITLGLLLLIDIYLIKGLLKGLAVSPLYTMGMLFGNIMIVLVFSLKLNGGKTRQSLMPFA